LILDRMPLDLAELGPALRAAFVSRGYAGSAAAAVFTAADWWGLKSARVRWAEYRRSLDEADIPDDLPAVVRGVEERLRPALRALVALP
jgi:hypothetical protein